jgi:hypothetical protein
MNKNFPGYYRPSEKELAKIWKTCTFVLDANVLLNLYRYPKSAREDLLRVFKRVSSRLWIPHQAALEYQRNRLDIIAEQVQRFDDVKNVLGRAKSDLGNGLAQLQLKKRHSTINPDAFLEKIENIVNEFLEELDKSQKEQPDVFGEDDLRNKIDLLLDNRVGTPPASQSDLDAIYTDGKTRYELKHPPGYEDLSKGKPNEKEPPSFISGRLTYKREFGDLILWLQIIEEAKAREWKQVIFITDDEKEDWWWIAESKGKKTIGPRPELVEEIMTKSGVASFYMYNSERFLAYANTFLKADVEQESIDQVREIAKLNRATDRRDIISAYEDAEHAVYDWLCSSYPQDKIIVNRHSFPDFLRINAQEGSKTGYEVKYFRNSSAIPISHMLKVRMKDVAYKGFFEISKGELSALKIVIILEEETIEETMKAIKNPKFEIPDGVQYLIGKLHNEEGKSNSRFILVSEA